MKNLINPMEWSDNAIRLISKDWMLITAGTAEKFNTMTASWGGVGYLWNKPVVYVFVRTERYTYEFMEQNDCFSLSFFGEEYKKVLSLLGSRSGREMDKMGDSGLTPYFTELGTPTFTEARITMECRKLYGTMLTQEAFVDQSLHEQWYTSHGGFHKMYVAQIVHLWKEE